MANFGRLQKINTYFGYNVVNNIKFNTFEGKFEKVDKKKVINATKSKHIKKISEIK